MGNFVNVYPTDDRMAVHVHTISPDWTTVSGLCSMTENTVSNDDRTDGSEDLWFDSIEEFIEHHRYIFDN